MFNYGDAGGECRYLRVGLLGGHQVANAATAVRACTLLRERGYPVGEDALRRGLRDATWPGRFEVVRDRPTVVLDSAHNPGAVRELRATLEEIFPRRRVILVFGVMGDKDAAGMMEVLRPVVRCAVVTRPRLKRAATTENLRRLAGEFVDHVEAAEEVVDALKLALRTACTEDVVCVTGSIFTVAEARAVLVP